MDEPLSLNPLFGTDLSSDIGWCLQEGKVKRGRKARSRRLRPARPGNRSVAAPFGRAVKAYPRVAASEDCLRQRKASAPLGPVGSCLFRAAPASCWLNHYSCRGGAAVTDYLELRQRLANSLSPPANSARLPFFFVFLPPSWPLLSAIFCNAQKLASPESHALLPPSRSRKWRPPWIPCPQSSPSMT